MPRYFQFYPTNLLCVVNYLLGYNITGENMIELSMYLDLLNSNCFPNWPAVFAVAESALTALKNSDPDFYNHLKMISKINVKVNPKVNI